MSCSDGGSARRLAGAGGSGRSPAAAAGGWRRVGAAPAGDAGAVAGPRTPRGSLCARPHVESRRVHISDEAPWRAESRGRRTVGDRAVALLQPSASVAATRRCGCVGASTSCDGHGLVIDLAIDRVTSSETVRSDLGVPKRASTPVLARRFRIPECLNEGLCAGRTPESAAGDDRNRGSGRENVKIQDLTPFRSLPQRALTTSSPRIL